MNVVFVLASLVMGLLVLSGCGTTSPAPKARAAGGSSLSDTDESPRGRARIHTDLAVSYMEIGNLGVALESAVNAQRADPSYGPAYNVAGLIYAELQDDRAAEESFRQALRINERDSDANNNYGAFLCQRKREAEGIKFFLLALRDPLYRTPERSYVNAGICARRRGDTEGAEQFFRSALKSDPNNLHALYQLTDMSYAKARYAEARPLLDLLRPVARNSPEILWLTLRNERRLGDSNALESLAHQLRTNFPNSREAELLAAGQFD